MARYRLYRLAVWTSAALLFGCVERQAHNETDNKPDQTILIPNELENAKPSQLLWCVQGRITNGEAIPLSGVTVSAHCGMGTLMRTGEAVTDADGRYKLNFGPGIMLLDDGAQMQVATISASKSGMVERDLGRAGDLVMASKQPSNDELQYWGATPQRVVLPGIPKQVDFVMVPAATVRGRVVDDTCAPVANTSIWLDADELPPSSSVLASATTDENGRFEYTEVPPGQVWLTMPVSKKPHREFDSAKIQCDAAMAYEVELTLRRAPVEGLEVRHIKRSAAARLGRSQDNRHASNFPFAVF